MIEDILFNKFDEKIMKRIIIFANLIVVSLYAMDVQNDIRNRSRNTNVLSLNRASNFRRFDLIDTIKRGSKYQLKKLLFKRANVDKADSDGVTPLMVAASLGKTPMIDILLKFNADVSKIDKNKNSALMRLMLNTNSQNEANRAKVVEKFVQRRPDIIHYKNAAGETPLTYAWNNNLINIAKTLIDYDIDYENEIWDYFEAELNTAQSDAKYEIFEYFIETRKFLEELKSSIDKGELDQIRELLKDSIELEVNGSKLLNLALTSKNIKDENSRLEIVRMLLDKGVNPNEVVSGGKHPLIIAQESKDSELVDLLLSYGAHKPGLHSVDQQQLIIDISDSESESESESETESESDTDKIKLNTIHDKITNKKKAFYGKRTFLQRIVKQEDIAMIRSVYNRDIQYTRFLLNTGLDVNITNSDRVTSLMYAAYQCNEPMIDLLLEYGADIKLKDKDKNSALLWAMMFKNENDKLRANVTQKLINKDYQGIFASNKFGETPLSLAWKYNYEDTAKVLIDNGAGYLDKVWEKRKEELDRLSDENSEEAEVKRRIFNYYNATRNWVRNLKILALNSESSKFNTLLHTREIKGGIGQTLLRFILTKPIDKHCKTEMFNELLNCGLDPDFRYSNGKTLLMIASIYGLTDIVKILINKNVDINAQDEKGNTALTAAAMNNNKDIVKLLLKYNARTDIKNRQGFDVKHLVSILENRDIIELFNSTKIQKENTKKPLNTNNSKQMRMKKKKSLTKKKSKITILQRKVNDLQKPANKAESTIATDKKQQPKTEISIVNKEKTEITTDKNQQPKTEISIINKEKANAKKLNSKIIEQNRKIIKEFRANVIAGKFDKLNLLLEQNEINNQLGLSLLKIILTSINLGNNSKLKDVNMVNKNKQLEIIKILLSKGIDPNVKVDEEKSFLMMAVISNNKEAVEELLKSGAKVDDRNNHGDTALIMASKHGFKNIIELLLQHGAKKELKNKLNRRARYYALLNGYSDIADMLKLDSLDQDQTENTLEEETNHINILKNQEEKTKFVEEIIEANNGMEPIIYEIKQSNNKKNQKDPELIKLSKEEKALLEELKESVISGDVKQLNSKRNNKNIKGYVGNELLKLAVTSTADMNKKIEMALNLLENGADPNSVYNNGRTILMIATQNKCEKIVDILLDKGAKINGRDKLGYTSLMIAASNNYIDLVTKLISRGAKVDQKNNRGKTAENFASLSGYDDIVNIICSADKLKNSNTSQIQNLFEKVKSGNVKAIKQLSIDNENLLNEVDEDGNNIALYAVKHQKFNIFNWLIRRDFNINHKNKEGDTVLSLLIKMKDKSHIVELVNSDCFRKENNKLIDSDNKGIFFGIASKNQEIISFFSSKENIDVPNEDGDTPLLAALKASNTSAIVFLIKLLGADLNKSNNEGKTPLLLSLEMKNIHAARFLIEKGANVNLKDKEGNSPLLLALKNKDFDMSWLLASKGASLDEIEDKINEEEIKEIFDSVKIYQLALVDKTNINVKNDKGETAVIRAIKYGHKQILEKLIKEGADLNILDSNNETPLFIAMKNNRKTIAKLLLKNGAMLQSENITALLTNKLKEGNFSEAWNLVSKDRSLKGIEEQLDTDESRYLLDTIKIYQKVLYEKENIDTKYSNGDTAIMRAVKCGHKSILNKLISKKPDVNIQDNEGNTPILIAVKKGFRTIFDSLLALKPKFDISNNEGEVPLLVAAKNNDIEIFKLIMSESLFPCGINNCDKDGNSALFYALKNQNSDMAWSLMDKNADRESVKKRITDKASQDLLEEFELYESTLKDWQRYLWLTNLNE